MYWARLGCRTPLYTTDSRTLTIPLSSLVPNWCQLTCPKRDMKGVTPGKRVAEFATYRLEAQARALTRHCSRAGARCAWSFEMSIRTGTKGSLGTLIASQRARSPDMSNEPNRRRLTGIAVDRHVEHQELAAVLGATSVSSERSGRPDSLTRGRTPCSCRLPSVSGVSVRYERTMMFVAPSSPAVSGPIATARYANTRVRSVETDAVP
jgi:hypothetical protein